MILNSLVQFAAACIGGTLIGAAWRESIPSLWATVGLGFFFVSQLRTQGWSLRLGSALATGLLACGISCSWLPETARYLLETDSVWGSWTAALSIWVLHSLPYVFFAIALPLCLRRFYAFGIMPALWVVSEVAVPKLFPSSIGAMLLDYPLLCQPAEIGGLVLLSLLAAIMALSVPAAWLCGGRLVRMLLATGDPGPIWKKGVGREKRSTRKRAQAKKQRAGDNKQSRTPSVRLSGLNRFCIGLLPCLMLATLGWSSLRLQQLREVDASAEELRVLIVQVDTAHPNAHARMFRASQKAQGQADLILWPECSLGNYEQSLADFSCPDRILEHSRDPELAMQPAPAPIPPLLAGGDSWVRDPQNPREEREFVSAFLFDRGRQLVGRHDKVHLMPYGESIPGESWLPQLRTFFGNPRVISAGESIRPIGKVQGFTLGVVLCCEDMAAGLSRSLANQQADLLVSLANGSAFKSEVALRQHFRLARARAIENRRFFLRCASRGSSALVAPSGEILRHLPILEDCAAMVRVPLHQRSPTIFMRLGEFPAIALALVMVACAYVPYEARIVVACSW